MGSRGSKNISGDRKNQAGGKTSKEATVESAESRSGNDPVPESVEAAAAEQTSSTADREERTGDQAQQTQDPQPATDMEKETEYVEAVVAKASEFGDNE